MSNDRTEPFTIGPCTLAFPSLFQPSKPRESDGAEKFNTAIVITGEMYAEQIKPKMDQLIAANFSQGDVANPRFNWGFLPCSYKPDTYPADLTAGMYYGNAKSGFKTDTVDAHGQPIIDPNVLRDGSQVYISINLYTFNKAGNVGIGIGLGPVMYVGDGPALSVGGGISASAAFAGVQIDPSMTPAPAGMPAAPAGVAVPQAAAPQYAAPAAPTQEAPPQQYAPDPAAPAAPQQYAPAPAAPAAPQQYAPAPAGPPGYPPQQ